MQDRASNFQAERTHRSDEKEQSWTVSWEEWSCNTRKTSASIGTHRLRKRKQTLKWAVDPKDPKQPSQSVPSKPSIRAVQWNISSSDWGHAVTPWVRTSAKKITPRTASFGKISSLTGMGILSRCCRSRWRSKKALECITNSRYLPLVYFHGNSHAQLHPRKDCQPQYNGHKTHDENFKVVIDTHTHTHRRIHTANHSLLNPSYTFLDIMITFSLLASSCEGEERCPKANTNNIMEYVLYECTSSTAPVWVCCGVEGPVPGASDQIR